MSVWYLELDDEITDAVARVRAAKDDRVVLVVPPGSRIGTGRINFRLLAREARARDVGIGLVSGDPQVRALAASAGLAVFATVSESEAAPTASLVPRDDIGATGGPPPIATQTISTAPGPAGSTQGAAAVAVVDDTARRGAVPVSHRRSVPRRAKIVGGSLAIVALVGGGALYGAYVTIPRATILLTQTAHTVTPEVLDLSVLPDQPTDATTGAIHGSRLPVVVTAQSVVTATGDGPPLNDRAHGVVTFTNHGVNPIPVSDLTSVRTQTGVQFLTQGGIVVPAGGSTDAVVRAEQSGAVGNVDAGAITVMPDDLKKDMNGGTVTNKEATTGGQSLPQKEILESDYQLALQALREQLASGLQAQAATPDGLPPDGVVYLSTVQPGAVVTDPGESEIVGQPVSNMQISGSMTGSVLTASMGDIRDVAAQMLQARAPGTDFVEGSIHVEPGDPTVTGDTVTYTATATGSAYDRQLDTDKLKEDVRGKTVSEAQGILDHYGTATITLSPDFMPSLPDDPNRIELTITPLGTTEP